MHTLAQLRNGGLKGVASLKLSEGLSTFPPEIFDLADTLEVLDLSRNDLSELPPDFGRLKKLRILFCSENQFTVLPEVLGDCPVLEMVGFKANKIETVPARALNTHLRWLILTDNSIASLPMEIGNCSRMQKLMLAGNQLTELPVAMANCRNLALLRISANRLQALPAWLLSMPKLSWLAFSGNPFSISANAAGLPVINWHQLHVHHILGEGASGIIYKALMHSDNKEKEVAVKVFKGAVTSDGLPEDEMNTFIAAGSHPGLVQVIGRIAEHPAGKAGVVMELIHGHFHNLGLPPTFETCTRDVFKQGLTLSLPQVLNIARTIASVAAQLHSRGIMHGDLYAHNILVDEYGNTLFGDFGAACMYPLSDMHTAASLEQLEVSAFGHLLDDLLSLCHQSANSTLATLHQLRNNCIADDVLQRPGFAQLSDQLANLGNDYPGK